MIVLPCTITDLIGQALSELTGVDIPFKTQSSEVGYDDHGLRILSWTVSSLSHNINRDCFLIIQITQSPRSISSIYPYRIVISAYL